MSVLSPHVRITISKKTPPQLWMVKHSAFRGDKPNYPAIVNLLAQPVKLTREWQFFIRGCNYAMLVQKVSALLNSWKAFTNGTGFDDPTDPRRNYLLRDALNADELPKFDKVRTCIRATHTGEVQGDYLWLETFDGNAPPPLKPGKRHPARVEDVNIDDYLYNPQDHRWMFFAANNIDDQGKVFPFDNGGFYDWFEDGDRQVTWLPLVSCFPVRLPMIYLEPVTSIPSPYYP
jgi:hypothetical protein